METSREYSRTVLPPRAALVVIDITRDSLLPASESGIELIGAPQVVENASTRSIPPTVCIYKSRR
jgi:hypothetical protein